MKTFQGENPVNRRVHTYKPSLSKKKPRNIPDNVELHIIDDDDGNSSNDYSAEDASKQLVLYNRDVTQDIDLSTLPHRSSRKSRYGDGTVLPSIGAYTVQCAWCYKWRVVPRKEKYEELRESICQELFVCPRALEWNRVLSCDEPEDLSQDGSRLWAIDKPNISQPPPGWDREVRIRGASKKFADVYYTSPSGKRLRSLVEIGRYLEENPQYSRQGVNLSQFSFAIPKPLEDFGQPAYTGHRELPEIPETAEVSPLCWAAPPTHRELLGGSSTSDPADVDQPKASDHVDLHQTVMNEPPAPHPKKRIVKQVSSRKRQRTPPAGSCSSEEWFGWEPLA